MGDEKCWSHQITFVTRAVRKASEISGERTAGHNIVGRRKERGARELAFLDIIKIVHRDHQQQRELQKHLVVTFVQTVEVRHQGQDS